MSLLDQFQNGITGWACSRYTLGLKEVVVLGIERGSGPFSIRCDQNVSLTFAEVDIIYAIVNWSWFFIRKKNRRFFIHISITFQMHYGKYHLCSMKWSTNTSWSLKFSKISLNFYKWLWNFFFFFFIYYFNKENTTFYWYNEKSLMLKLQRNKE